MCGNQITSIGVDAFPKNFNLLFLKLSRNKIAAIQNLKHLTKLEHLDLSHNQIEEVAEGELPPRLISLKLYNNPVHERAERKKQLSVYRRPIVLALPHLVDLDKVEIMPVERMHYQGLVKRKVDMEKMLLEKIRSDNAKKKAMTIQTDLRIQIKNEDMG